MEAISLYELNNRIKQTLKASFADSVWITAEITAVSYTHLTLPTN